MKDIKTKDFRAAEAISTPELIDELKRRCCNAVFYLEFEHKGAADKYDYGCFYKGDPLHCYSALELRVRRMLEQEIYQPSEE